MVSNKSRNCKSSMGSVMVCIVLLVMSIEYYAFAVMTWYPRVRTNLAYWAIPILAVFHFLAFMLLWSFLMTLFTDSGEVPIYWGFRVGDPDDRRRRYCLMCNLYKPERCHHCSACGRCVLNMDHHCPWVNNCIGFKNRKYFMLLLFYVQITTIFLIFAWSLDLIKSCKVIYADISSTKLHYNDLRKAIITIICYLFAGMICVMMGFFFSFHRKLVKENKTTIENIEHNSDPKYESKYNIDFWHNVTQVMGTNKWIWWIPIMPASNMPPGQGIYFEKRYESEDSDDDGGDNRPNNYQNHERNDFNRGSNNMIERLTKQGDGSKVQDRNRANGDNHIQADRMTIHEENQNKWENLNNIVQSENANQIYKSSESHENAQQEESKQGYANPQRNMPPPRKEGNDKQYLERSTYGNTSKGNPGLGGGRSEGERAESKSSTGQLIRRTKGQGSGQKVKPKGNKFVNQVKKESAHSKTGRPTKKRTTANSRGRVGAGFR